MDRSTVLPQKLVMVHERRSRVPVIVVWIPRFVNCPPYLFTEIVQTWWIRLWGKGAGVGILSVFVLFIDLVGAAHQVAKARSEFLRRLEVLLVSTLLGWINPHSMDIEDVEFCPPLG